MTEETKNGRYVKAIFSAVRRLCFAQNMLAPRNMRKNCLKYFFAFPLAMIIINIQNHLLSGSFSAFGLPRTTITFMAFAAGVVLIFLFANEDNLAKLSKASAAAMACGLLPWLILADGTESMICEVIFMAGLGGCMSCSSFSYVFILNNTERFFGAVLMITFIDLIKFNASVFLTSTTSQKFLTMILILGLCAVMYKSDRLDFKGKDSGETTALDVHADTGRMEPGILLVLYVFMSYFAVRITGFYVPAFQSSESPQMLGMLSLALILICVVMLVIFKRSIWMMCNVFFISAILSYVMWFAGEPDAAYVLSEVKEVGLLTGVYLIGCVTNKFCSFKMHKLLLTMSVGAVALIYLGVDIANKHMPTQPLAISVTAILFIGFLMLSPAYSQFLFFAGWAKEFRQINMTAGLQEETSDHKTAALPPDLADTGLSPREEQVVRLLLKGMTVRQAAPELGLTTSTVSTYCKSAYKKLGINSRAELFLMFGRTAPKDDEK